MYQRYSGNNISFGGLPTPWVILPVCEINSFDPTSSFKLTKHHHYSLRSHYRWHPYQTPPSPHQPIHAPPLASNSSPNCILFHILGDLQDRINPEDELDSFHTLGFNTPHCPLPVNGHSSTHPVLSSNFRRRHSRSTRGPTPIQLFHAPR